jgi:hypothetical protein
VLFEDKENDWLDDSDFDDSELEVNVFDDLLELDIKLDDCEEYESIMEVSDECENITVEDDVESVECDSLDSLEDELGECDDELLELVDEVDDE